MRENVNGNSSDSIAVSVVDTDSGSQKKDPRRKLMWAGVATLVALSIALALPVLSSRSSLFERLLRPIRHYWPLSLSLTRVPNNNR